jgi:hypothetical protein
VLGRGGNALEGLQESPDHLVRLKQEEAMERSARLLRQTE